MATFITAQTVGSSIQITVNTTTGYWKFYHDGNYSSARWDGSPQMIDITNPNGEVTLFSCDSDGTTNGDITLLDFTSTVFNGCQVTSFDGTGLTALTTLNLGGNPLTTFIGGDMELITEFYFNGYGTLTSFDGGNMIGLTNLQLSQNQLTSFDGTGLSNLIYLYLDSNQLTSFDGTGLSNLNYLNLGNNQLTSFDGTDLTSLNGLQLSNNQLTSLDGFILPSNLNELILSGNQLTSFDGTDLTSLTFLDLLNNQLTSFDGTGLTSLNELYLNNNQLTSLSGFIFPTNLTYLTLIGNHLTSFSQPTLSNLTALELDANQLHLFDGTGLTSLNELYLSGNQLTSLDVSGLINLTILRLVGKGGNNPMTASANDSILSQLNINGLSDGDFKSINGRTSAGTADYNSLISKNWSLSGLDLTGGNGGVNIYGKLRIKGATTIGGGVTPPLWDGGTIYNIGAVVTFDNQTWNCIQYAPAGYGPFGGYIDVYWTL
jgi:hypothetical protein